MRTDFVVIFEVGFENLPQLPFIEHDHSIQAFSPNGTDQALDVRDFAKAISGRSTSA